MAWVPGGGTFRFMRRRDFLEPWGLAGLKLKLPFLDAEFKPLDPDRTAARDPCAELLTPVTTQRAAPEEGDEKSSDGSQVQLCNDTPALAAMADVEHRAADGFTTGTPSSMRSFVETARGRLSRLREVCSHPRGAFRLRRRRPRILESVPPDKIAANGV